jgi:hypothetical protein
VRLNQTHNVIVGHGISLLRWRSEVVKQPHDMPPSRFDPSPTSGDSSRGDPLRAVSPSDHTGLRWSHRAGKLPNKLGRSGSSDDAMLPYAVYRSHMDHWPWSSR